MYRATLGTQNTAMPSVIVLTAMPSVIVLNFDMLTVIADCRYAQCLCAKCCYAGCHYAECHYA
jgi:hypothetical protein